MAQPRQNSTPSRLEGGGGEEEDVDMTDSSSSSRQLQTPCNNWQQEEEVFSASNEGAVAGRKRKRDSETSDDDGGSKKIDDGGVETSDDEDDSEMSSDDDSESSDDNLETSDDNSESSEDDGGETSDDSEEEYEEGSSPHKRQGKKKNEDNESVPEFSIRRLDLARLDPGNNGSPTPKQKTKQERKEERNKTKKVIKDVVKDINSSPKRGGSKYKKVKGTIMMPKVLPEGKSYKFRVLPYHQKNSSLPIVPRLFGSEICHDWENIIVFYYRCGVVFVISWGNSSWKAIQPYCCYDFPDQINRRLGSSEGNLKETWKPLTGNTRLLTLTNSQPTNLERLGHILYSATKWFRQNASIYNLDGVFDPRRPSKFRIGMACVRFLKKLLPEHIPQLLDHLSRIVNKKTTWKYPIIQNENGIIIKEKEKDNIYIPKPYLRKASNLECNPVEAEKEMYAALISFMDGKAKQSRIIDMMHINHIRTGDFADATHYKLIVGAKVVGSFTRIPTTEEILLPLKLNKENMLPKGKGKVVWSDLDPQSKDPEILSLVARCFDKVKIQYLPESHSRYKSARLVDCLEFEICLENNVFWRMMGGWWYPTTEYYVDVHAAFVELLNGEGVLLLGKDQQRGAYLDRCWSSGAVKDRSDYLKLYAGREEEGYLVSPSSLGKYFFDMLYVVRDEKGGGIRHLFIYFLFDSFDTSFRGAAGRVEKALENVLGNKEGKLLERFYRRYKRNLRTNFPRKADFREYFQKRQNISVVIALNTEDSPPKKISSTMINPCTSSSQKTGTCSAAPPPPPPGRKLEREKNLKLSFTENFAKESILKNLQRDAKATIMKVFMQDPDFNINAKDGYGLSVIKMLVKQGYFIKSLTSGRCGGFQVGGNLLKINRLEDFQFSVLAGAEAEGLIGTEELQHVKRVVFEELRGHFLSQFPGFIHKLECIKIQKCLTEKCLPMLIMEIPHI